MNPVSRTKSGRFVLRAQITKRCELYQHVANESYTHAYVCSAQIGRNYIIVPGGMERMVGIRDECARTIQLANMELGKPEVSSGVALCSMALR